MSSLVEDEQQISSLNMEHKKDNNNEWQMGERIDCLDLCDKWLDAKVIDIKLEYGKEEA